MVSGEGSWKDEVLIIGGAWKFPKPLEFPISTSFTDTPGIGLPSLTNEHSYSQLQWSLNLRMQIYLYHDIYEHYYDLTADTKKISTNERRIHWLIEVVEN